MFRDEETFREEFDIVATASYVLHNGFQRVALQFPDELLRHSVAVSSALQIELSEQMESNSLEEEEIRHVRLFVMADTTFGSCCADEVAAMHVNAECIVHYGHTCMSVSSRLPVWFVYGRETIDAEKCAICISKFAASCQKPILVLVGLKYIYAADTIHKKVVVSQEEHMDINFAKIPSQMMKPVIYTEARNYGCDVAKPTLNQDSISKSTGGTSCQIRDVDFHDGQYEEKNAEASGSTKDSAGFGPSEDAICGSEYNIGGFTWIVPRGRTMADYVIVWIGGDDPGLTNTTLIFNRTTVVRYDSLEDRIVTDVLSQSSFLQRRYYYVERAKDANVVGIVVGTLGVAGYQEVIQRVRRMVEAAGKKAYTLVMGKPNPAKLANFPECEVFVLVSCPQTALLDSKEFLAPLITPFEAELAFLEGKRWTGAYKLDFIATDPGFQSMLQRTRETLASEPRFSFFSGSYVGKDQSDIQDGEGLSSRAVVLSHASQRALELQSETSLSVISTKRSVLDIKSGAEYLASRTFNGLDINQEGPEGPRKDSLAVVGSKGRATGYGKETGN